MGFVVPFDALRIEELPDGRVKLLHALHFCSRALGGRTVKAPRGFVSDKESVPRWLPLTYALFSGTANRAGVIHDFLYQTHRAETLSVPRWLADRVYPEAAEADGNGWLKRWGKWAGVRLGGAWAYASGPERFQVLGNERRRRPRQAPESREPE